MAVRAKFKVNSITTTEYGIEAKASPVYSDKGENASFAKATPSGDLRLVIDKSTAAADFFKVGQFLYLDISEAPKD